MSAEPEPASAGPPSDPEAHVRSLAARLGLPDTPAGLREAREALDRLVEYFKILKRWDDEAKARGDTVSDD